MESIDMRDQSLWRRVLSRVPIVRMMRTHKDERAEAEREREELRAEQSRLMYVNEWLADVRRRRPPRRESNEHGG